MEALIREKNNDRGKQKLRIIGGQWRGRRLEFIEADGLRPTGDRVRETLFNWVQTSLPGSRCLDLFAGSGALGLEAASRGAASVVLVDNNSQVCRLLKSHVSELGADDAIRVANTDALSFLEKSEDFFDLVFLDPPFGHSLLLPAIELLYKRKMLRPGASIYLESEKGLEPPALPANWEVKRTKTSGKVDYSLLVTGS